MATVFTRIIDGEIPGRFVWADDEVVAFLTIEPNRHGHVLVVPRAEVDPWTALPPALRDRVFEVAQIIGGVLLPTFPGERVALVIAGYGVPHTHVHVYPTQSITDFDQTAVMRDVPAADLDADADLIRDALRAAGHAASVPDAGPLP